ncbi:MULTISPECIES: type II toxin-antitoxin system HipA family toxin [unclassified Rathayibacter]|uniref:type II toxin-antitoxin system HipA family toxin n=1 Tax=unclassified Rathayibacter TaxID=2609250 RepID=UPI0006F1CAC7|nr:MULTISPECIES: type II toxin-antitoxin system HipA family toxin [unclassified Rathayibacter]KQQ03545.1 hypothetical protein ASF42_08575 [Rathayibacter sp. Leaf294]KQS12001.1 hypothetical protein ASG06_08575 [Rathayibacter sp. Leaf185]
MSGHDALDVHVELNGRTALVGRAHFHRPRGTLTSTTFQYDADYLGDPDAYAIDPALRLVSGSQQTSGLPGAFADSAPDRWGRNLIAKQERGRAREQTRRARTLDDVDFLVGVSDVTRQGALRFRADPRGPFLDPDHEVPRLISLPMLLRAADSAVSDPVDGDLEAVKILLAAGTGSLGGARPKASVLDEDGHPLIVKFPHHSDEWDLMAWEATALDLAAASGVRVPSRRLSRIDGRHVLLLDRFDRSGSRPTVRIGYTSAMTMLERHDGETADYADIAEQLPEVSASATDDAHELFRRAALSVGLNNTDDHLRNHGFLRARGGWRLSPAFDINPNPEATARQTTIGGAEVSAQENDGLLVLAADCRLSIADARVELTRVADALERWRDIARTNGIPHFELGRFEDSFRSGLGTLREAARSPL